MNKPLVLLHICCAPCASAVIKRVQNEYEIKGFFYNPNIFPESEYQLRLSGVRRLADILGIEIDSGDYEYDRFRELVLGLEREPEGGKRCLLCYRLRLERSGQEAKANGAEFLATTLTIGSNKKAAVINPLGAEICARLGIKFIAGDWKKQNGFKHSVEISRNLGLYRQNYCGCEFSQNFK